MFQLSRTAIGCLSAASLLTALPVAAQDYRHHHYRHACERARHRAGTNGAVIGALGGGVAGNLLTHGGLGGTLIGAGAGAVAGHEIAKNGRRC